MRILSSSIFLVLQRKFGFSQKKICMSSPPNVPGCANLGLWDGSFGTEKITKQEMAKWNSDKHFLSRFLFIWHWWGCSFSGPARELSVRCGLINLGQVPGASPAIPAWGHQQDWFRWTLAAITGFLFPGAGVAGGSCQCLTFDCWLDQLKY